MRLSVIGLGPGASHTLCGRAKELLAGANTIIGSERQLALVASLLSDGCQQRILPKLSELKAMIVDADMSGVSESANQEHLCLLASGDPLFYGIGSWALRQFDPDQVELIPAVSSIQAACNKAQVALQDLEVISLHGRPLNNLHAVLRPRSVLVALTDRQSHPKAIAQLLYARGFSNATLVVCERLGYPDERVSEWPVERLRSFEGSFADLNVVVMKTHDLDQGAWYLPSTAGFPDDIFETGKAGGRGMISKREVRAQILSYLGLKADEVLWDVGAGCGSVSIEAAVNISNRPGHRIGKIYAVERDAGRVAFLNLNRKKFGVESRITVVEGDAPQSLADLPVPDKIFVGGSGGNLDQILSACWSVLGAGKTFVVSTVTEQSCEDVKRFFSLPERAGCFEMSMSDIAVSRIDDARSFEIEARPMLPVKVFAFTKLN